MKVKKLKKKYNGSISVNLYPKGRTKKMIETTVGEIPDKYDDRKISEIWGGGEKGLEVVLKKKKKKSGFMDEDIESGKEVIK